MQEIEKVGSKDRISKRTIEGKKLSAVYAQSPFWLWSTWTAAISLIAAIERTPRSLCPAHQSHSYHTEDKGEHYISKPYYLLSLLQLFAFFWNCLHTITTVTIWKQLDSTWLNTNRHPVWQLQNFQIPHLPNMSNEHILTKITWYTTQNWVFKSNTHQIGFENVVDDWGAAEHGRKCHNIWQQHGGALDRQLWSLAGHHGRHLAYMLSSTRFNKQISCAAGAQEDYPGRFVELRVHINCRDKDLTLSKGAGTPIYQNSANMPHTRIPPGYEGIPNLLEKINI